MMSLFRQASKAMFTGLDLFALPLAGPRVLIYHQLGGGSGLEMEVDPDALRWQLDWLANNWRVLDLDSALTEASDEFVVLTFDDGYRSLYEIAYPLLLERSLPFTLYLTTQPIETGRPLRDHQGAEPLTWDMVRTMVGSGLLTVGAHTHSHPDLRRVGKGLLEQELSASDSLITKRIGVTPRHFAYPWGYWSPDADVVIRGRYETAALGSRTPRAELGAESHLFHRIPIQRSDSKRWFTSRVRGGLLFEESVRRQLRGYRGP